MPLTIERIDHIVMTVHDMSKTVRFYCDILGMKEVAFGDDRTALAFGNQKINLHPVENDIAPTAAHPAPGSLDICVITTTPIAVAIDELQRRNIVIEQGPVQRQGARGNIISIYIRDPDGNLVEIANDNNP